MQEYQIKDLTLLVNFSYKQGKRGYTIRYVRENIVEFISGKMFSSDEIALELSKHYRFLKRRVTEQEIPKGDTLHLFGEEYKIKRVESKERKILLSGDTLILYSDTSDYAINHQIVYTFYFECLKEYIKEELPNAREALKVYYPLEIQFKNVKTYFGECFPKRKVIIFSLSLAKYPKYYIKSVIYHELAHFYYANHQDGFYRLLESVFPNYKQAQANLRRLKYQDMY